MGGRTPFDPRLIALKPDGSLFPVEEHPVTVALRTGKPQNNVLMSVAKLDGTRSLIKINAIPIFDANSSTPISVVSSFSDISSIFEEKEYLEIQLKALLDNQNRIEANRRRLELANQELRDSAEIDPLTKLKNRRSFFERLNIEISQASRHQSHLSMIIVDIAQPKTVNESNDAESLDEFLIQLSKMLKETSRMSDFLARYRSDELVMILPSTALHEAKAYADRLIGLIQNIELEHPFSVCIGVAEFRMGTLQNDFIEQAEEALFRAKALGSFCCYSAEI